MNKIKRLRIEKNMSIEDLSSSLGISVDELKAIENGDMQVGNQMLADIANNLHVPLETMFENDFKEEIIKEQKSIESFKWKWFIIGIISFLVATSIVLGCIFTSFTPQGIQFSSGIESLFIDWTYDYVILKLMLVACVVVFILSVVFSCQDHKKKNKFNKK